MKTLLCTLMLATLGAAAAKADSVTITFVAPNQIAYPGETLQFFGTITNDTNTTLYLNSDDPNLSDPSGVSFSLDDLFFSNVPISLAPEGQPGASSGVIELFDIVASSPLLDPVGTYPGTYTLFGGADGGADTAQNSLGSANFSVSITPEPSTFSYLLLGALPVLVPLSRKLRQVWRKLRQVSNAHALFASAAQPPRTPRSSISPRCTLRR